MKTLATQLAHFLRKETSRKNLKTLARLLLVLAAIVVVYSVIFHVLMMREGREFSLVHRDLLDLDGDVDARVRRHHLPHGSGARLLHGGAADRHRSSC